VGQGDRDNTEHAGQEIVVEALASIDLLDLVELQRAGLTAGVPEHRRQEPVHSEKADSVNREKRPRLSESDADFFAHDFLAHQDEHKFQRIDVEQDHEEQRDVEEHRGLVLQRAGEPVLRPAIRPYRCRR